MESHLGALSQEVYFVSHSGADRCDLDVPMKTSVTPCFFFLTVSREYFEYLNFSQ